MSVDITTEQNFIEAKMIIQEFYDDSTVFVVGTAPFGKLWFDQEKIDKQYNMLCDNWTDDYDDKSTIHSKKPRIISVLISEHDPMFNEYRDSIREAQARKNLAHEIAMQMKIAEAVKAAMNSASMSHDVTASVSVATSTTTDSLPVPPPTSAQEPVVKEKKPRAKKGTTPAAAVSVPVPVPVPNPEQNVVIKKATKPRQKKETAKATTE
jgi:hypothetical protein